MTTRTLMNAREISSHFLLPQSAAVTLGRDEEREDCHAVLALASSWLRRLRLVQIAAARHGKGGHGSLEVSGPAIIEGTADEIRALETELECERNEVAAMYEEVRSAFYRDGTINPSDAADGGNSVFTFHFGMYSAIVVSVWADHLENALELATDHLYDIAPGYFVSQEEMAEALAEACAERGFTPADIDWSDLCGEHAAAVEAAECDLTILDQGCYIRSDEWSVSESDTPPGPSASKK